MQHITLSEYEEYLQRMKEKEDGKKDEVPTIFLDEKQKEDPEKGQQQMHCENGVCEIKWED